MAFAGAGILPSGQFGPSRLLRGTFRKGGRYGGASFTWLPDWDKKTKKAVEPSGAQMARAVHQAMVAAMSQVSRHQGGGGVESRPDDWIVSVGTVPATHRYWHLLEFGGGRHYARAPIRNALSGLGRFTVVAK